MNDSKRIEEEKPKPDLTGIVPKWVVDMSKDMHSLADIEKIDDMVFTMPPAKLKDMHSRLDMNAFAKFMEQQLEANKSSPIRLTSMLRINGKPFTLSKHRFFEPLFYPDLPDLTCAYKQRAVG
jgi:hypothetical protein